MDNGNTLTRRDMQQYMRVHRIDGTELFKRKLYA